MICTNTNLKKLWDIDGTKSPACYQDDNKFYYALLGNKTFYTLFFNKLSLLYSLKPHTISQVVKKTVQNYPMLDKNKCLLSTLSIVKSWGGQKCPLNKLSTNYKFFNVQRSCLWFCCFTFSHSKNIRGDKSVPLNICARWTFLSFPKVKGQNNGVFLNMVYSTGEV